MQPTKIYYDSGGLVVRPHVVITPRKEIPISSIGMVRALRWRGRYAILVDLCSSSGSTNDVVEFSARAGHSALAFASAVNLAISQETGDPAPSLAVPPQPQRSAIDLVLIGATAIIVAVVALVMMLAFF